MIAEFISRVLLHVFGYFYPAFECFKVVESRAASAHQLRFWCQYWIIVGVVLAFENFISWIPMYGELKLALFLYLWYPKTKGSDIVYETFVRPVVMQYEPNIEQRLLNLREKSGELLSFYVKNFTDKGTGFFVDVMRYVFSGRTQASSNAERNNKRHGWSPFAVRRPSPSVPPYADDINPDAVAVAEVLRGVAVRARPRHGKGYDDQYS